MLLKKTQAILILFLYLSLSISISCSSSTVKAPKDMGTYAFELLKQFDTMNDDTFISYCMTLREFKNAVSSPNVEENIKEASLKTAQKKYNERLKTSYITLKSEAKMFGIVWKDIKFSNYTFDLREDKGLPIVHGKLYFTHASKTYSVDVMSIKHGSGYKLFIINQLKAL